MHDGFPCICHATEWTWVMSNICRCKDVRIAYFWQWRMNRYYHAKFLYTYKYWDPTFVHQIRSVIKQTIIITWNWIYPTMAKIDICSAFISVATYMNLYRVQTLESRTTTYICMSASLANYDFFVVSAFLVTFDHAKSIMDGTKNRRSNPRLTQWTRVISHAKHLDNFTLTGSCSLHNGQQNDGKINLLWLLAAAWACQLVHRPM